MSAEPAGRGLPGARLHDRLLEQLGAFLVFKAGSALLEAWGVAVPSLSYLPVEGVAVWTWDAATT